MSRKLATTIKDSRIPGKYKRIAEAYAAFANNDGTNIYASKEKLGSKAGCSRDTVYRITPELIAAGVLKIAESHTCKIDNCNKGATHFTGRWGHYTTAYVIQIDALQNAERYLTAKCLKVNAAKCRKVPSAKCGTTQGIKDSGSGDENQSPKVDENMSTNSSALTSGSELVSEGTDDSLRSSSTLSESQTAFSKPSDSEVSPDSPAIWSGVSGAKAEQEQDQSQNQEQDQIVHWHCGALNTIWHRRTGKAFTKDEYALATDLIAQQGYNVVEAVLDITLNKREKSAKMVWKRFQVFVDNWQTNYDLSMAWTTVQEAKKNYPRPIPAKFDCTNPKTKEEADGLKSYFRERCKTDDWKITSQEWSACGATEDAFTGALRFCCDNCRKVSKQEFLSLIFEAMGSVTIEPKAAAAGVEDAD